MTNKEVFEQYGTEQWVIEQNLCSLLLEFKEKIKNDPGINLVSFIKDFMREETFADVEWAERSKIDTLEKKVIIDIE